MNGDCILTLSEVATRLRVSEKTVRRRISSGVLKRFKEGGLVRVMESDLVDYLTRQIKETGSR